MSDLEAVKEALAEVAKDGRVVCRDALALAERLGVDPKQVGAAANEFGVKIKGCQLGCF